MGRPSESHDMAIFLIRKLERFARLTEEERAALARVGSRNVKAFGTREDIVHEIQEVFEGTVIWGEDLMRLGVSGSKVTTIEPRTQTRGSQQQ